MESLTKNRQSNDTIARLAKHIFNQDLIRHYDSITELKEGWFNAAYLVKLKSGLEVILKIAPKSSIPVMTYEKDMMKNEVFMMKKAKSIGIPCPLIYGYDNSHILCDSDYFFMEKLEGQNFEKIKSTLSESDIQNINHHIGRYTYTWNQITASYFGYPHQKNLQSKSWKEAFLKMVVAVLKDGLTNKVDVGFPYESILSLYHTFSYTLDEVTKPHFVHWDCWDSNVFIQNQKISGFLDFERAFFGDPLAKALFRMKNPDQLKGYGKTEFTENEQIRMALYDGYLALIMIIEDSYRFYDTKDIKNYGLGLLKHTLDQLNTKKNKRIL